MIRAVSGSESQCRCLAVVRSGIRRPWRRSRLYRNDLFAAIAQTKDPERRSDLAGDARRRRDNYLGSQDSRFVDRYSHQVIRGFEPNGIGPTEAGEQLGGNYFAALKFEAEFPLGTPEEFGISGGVFYDIGSIWDVDTSNATRSAQPRMGSSDRHVVGCLAVLGIALWSAASELLARR